MTVETNKMKYQIMCVEDHLPLAKLMKLSLEKAGYAVSCVHSGDLAFNEAKDRNPDLIILDVMMPMMDGFQILQELKSDKEISRIPVIMVTARSEKEDRQRALESGAAFFLTKPFQNKELVAKVHEVLGCAEK